MPTDRFTIRNFRWNNTAVVLCALILALIHPNHSCQLGFLNIICDENSSANPSHCYVEYDVALLFSRLQRSICFK
uniref:Secreted protein n=1 Tax=Heterorhabditis bacteriophora TaxID=37862 RepID=A0A1I7W8T7_HETBA